MDILDLARLNGPPRYETHFQSLANWAQLIGTLTAAGGQVTCSAMAVDGKELLSNTGFETAGAGGADVFGSWTESASDGAIADETVDVYAGGHAVKLTAGASANTRVYQTVGVTAGVTYGLAFWAHGDGTSAGTYLVSNQLGTTRASGSTGVTGATYQQVAINVTAQAGDTSFFISLFCPAVAGGIAYADAASTQRQLAITVAPRWMPHGTLERAFYAPAVATTPRCPILFRIARTSGAINHWEVRVTPNTAGTDLELIENNAGTMTQRIAVDVDWTADVVNRVKVDFRGPVIKLYHWKSGAAGWTLGGTYSTATFGLGNGLFGIGAYQAATLGTGLWLKAVAA